MVRSVTVFPPVLGPVTMSARKSVPSSTSIGTTRPVSPGWRAPRRTISARAEGSARTASISSARRAFALQKSNRARASSVSLMRPAWLRDEGRQLVEDPLDLGGLGQLCLAPGIAELDGHERLDEERLPAAGRVVDDPLDAAPGIGPHRDHVAPVAEGDDRVLEGAAHVARVDELLEPCPQALVGVARRPAQGAQAGRRRVEQLPGRVEAPLERRAQARQRMEAPRELVEERSPVFRQEVAQARCSFERLGDLGELDRIEPTAAGGAIHGGPTSCAPPMPALGRSASRARTCDVSSRPISTSTGSADGRSASARRRPGGNPVAAARRSRTRGNSRRAIDLASIRARGPRRGPGPRRTATGDRPTPARRTPRRPERWPRLARRVPAPGRLQAQGAGRVEEVASVVTTLDAEGGGEVRRAGRKALQPAAGRSVRPRPRGRRQRRDVAPPRRQDAPAAWPACPGAAPRRGGGRRRRIQRARRRR